MIIDVHGHFVPPKILAEVKARSQDLGVKTVQTPEGQSRLVFQDGSATAPFPPPLTNKDKLLEQLRLWGVDRMVVSVWTDVVGYTLPRELGVQWSRLLNEALAEELQSEEGKKHWIGMATIPAQDGEAAAEELEYAVNRLGFRSFVISSNINGKNLDDPSLSPLWDCAVRLGVPVMIHPERVGGGERLQSYFLKPVVGYPYETTLAAASLIFGGVWERFTDLRVILVHGGGFFPYQAGRLQRGYDNRPEARELCKKPPRDALNWFYYDSILHSTDSLCLLLDLVGPERILLGSDSPFPIGDPDPVESVKALRLDAAVTQEILGGTAARLFGVSGP